MTDHRDRASRFPLTALAHSRQSPPPAGMALVSEARLRSIEELFSAHAGALQALTGEVSELRSALAKSEGAAAARETALLDLKSTALLLGVDLKTFRRLRQGKLASAVPFPPAVQIGSAECYSLESVLDWIANSEQAAK